MSSHSLRSRVITGQSETPAESSVLVSDREEVRPLPSGDVNDAIGPNSSERPLTDPLTMNGRGCNLKLATWNVRTMYQAGKLDNVINEMERYGIDILCVQETRWLDAGCIEKDGHKMYFSGGGQHRNGVGIIVNGAASKAVNGYLAVSDRVIMIKLSGKPFDITIVSAYAPTQDHSDEILEQFYSEVDECLKHTKAHEVLFIGGDWNAKVGDKKLYPHVGGYGLGTQNSRGERMVQMCVENNLVISNTWFQKPKRRLYTWKSPGDLYRNQIDYILVNHRFRNSVTNISTYPGADASSDHNLLVANIKMKIKIPKKSKYSPKFNVEMLQLDNFRKQFNIEVRNSFSLLSEEAVEQLPDTPEGIEQDWNILKNSISEATTKTVPKKGKKKEKGWMTEDILNKMQERKNKKGTPEYDSVNKDIKMSCKIAKEEWYNKMCDRIEELEKEHKIGEMHRHVKVLTDRKRNIDTTSGCIRDADGALLFEKDKVASRWVEYIKNLYDDETRPEPETIRGDEGPSILKEELIQAIKDMKAGKAPGIDAITTEQLKALDDDNLTILTDLCQQIYLTGYIPSDMKHSSFIKIPKKSKATECSDHRTIALMSHVLKALLKIILNRNTNLINEEIGDTQSGFKNKIGTREGILNLRLVLEKYLEINKKVYLCFIDYEKAFDRVYHQKLMELLKKSRMDGRDQRLIQNLYWNQTASVKLDSEESESFPIKRGVRQGCVISPKLFNWYTEIIFQEADELRGVNIGGVNYTNLRFADDTVLMAESDTDLQAIVNKVKETSAVFGMKMNVKKTKTMIVDRERGNNDVANIIVDGKTLEQVDKFVYLGHTITADGTSEVEIRKRIEIARQNFIKMGDVLASRKLKLETRKRLIKCYILSTLLYAAETWTFSKETWSRIEAFEMWMYRKMLKVRYTDHVTNEEVLRRAKAKRNLRSQIMKRKTKYFGHIVRANKLQKQLLQGKLEGRRCRGRPRRTWTKDIEEWTKMSFIQCVRKSEDRGLWRKLAAKLPGEEATSR